ncbi:hypothetical protein VYU27_004660 [Nannochloropsis oceanica]
MVAYMKGPGRRPEGIRLSHAVITSSTRVRYDCTFLGPALAHQARRRISYSGISPLHSSTVQQDEARASRAGNNPALAPGKAIRAQRLKDLLLEKELRNDISTAEFALNLDIARIEPRSADGKAGDAGAGKGSGASYSSKMRPRGVIDYEKIAEKLEKSLELVDRRQGRMAAAVGWGARAGGDTEGTKAEPRSIGEESTLRVTKRLSETRSELQNVLWRVRASMVGTNSGNTKIGEGSGTPGGATSAAEVGAGTTTAGEEGERPMNPFTVFVREDGTVDWDGAFQSGKELAKYSGEVFERLQGKSPGEEETPPKASTSLATIDATPGMQVLQQFLQQLESGLRSAEDERDKILELHKALRKQGLDVSKAQKGELRIAEDQAVEMRRRVELQRLDMDMERVCAYIEQEIDQSTSIREQKLLVAEFGLLDAQLSTLLTMLQASEPYMDGSSSLLELDEDELRVVASEVQDLKTRLGLVEDTTGGPKVDWSLFNAYVQESIGKIRKGVSFYVTGGKLLTSDLQYAWWLISRAAQGYTLKPREVRTLQRTAKDLLTLIPFTIILIIPLTPIGHVLIFSLIQRIFPDFFPSTFTERRQNLSKMYDEIDKKPSVEGTPPP